MSERFFRKITAATLLLVLLLPGPADGNAQMPEGIGNGAVAVGPGARLSVLTVGPADPLYTMFGHTAVRLQDPARQTDVVYNYGTFDFETRFFALKFLYGNLNYFLSKSSFEAFAGANRALGRSIREQVLNLSPRQVDELIQDMETELASEDRFYRYEFFRNNCTTKVRDLLARNQLLMPSRLNASSPSETSFRQLLRPYLQRRPWIRLGIDLLLGAPADDTASKWQQNYLPYMFYQTLSKAGLPNSIEPLTSETRLLVPAAANARISYWLTPVPVFWVLFLLVAGITLSGVLKKINAIWLDRILFGAVGLAGLVLLPVSFLSLHEPLQPNWNLLWALPTHLVIAAGIKQLQQKSWFRYYMWVTLALHISLLAGWFLIPQQLPAAVIPLLSALAIRLLFRLIEGGQKSFGRQ
jgi:hypothetical protein